MKDMLENDRPADAETVKHIDRCLSCLSCMTTCPSGVNYMHLVDHARAHIAKTYKRAADGPADAHPARADPALPRPLRPCAPRRAPRQAVCRAGAEALQADACDGAGPAARARRQRQSLASIRHRAQKSCGSACLPAARSGCSTPPSTRRRSACSPASVSRWWWWTASAAAARCSTTWARRTPRTRWPPPTCAPSWRRSARGGSIMW